MSKLSNTHDDVIRFESVSEEERLKSLRDKRKRKRQIQLGIFIAVIVLVLLVILYMFTDISKVDKVDIKGNDLITKKEVQKILNITQETRIYNVSKKDIETKLMDRKETKSVEIKKEFPNDLQVRIKEYKPVALIQEKNKFITILENGKKLDKQNRDIPIDVPILNDFKKQKLKKTVLELKKVKPNVLEMISEINYKPGENNENRIQLFMVDNVEVIADIPTFAKKINYYPSISDKLEKDDSGQLKTPGFIDLQIGATFLPYKSETSDEQENESNQQKDNSSNKKEQKKLDKTLQDVSKKIDKPED